MSHKFSLVRCSFLSPFLSRHSSMGPGSQAQVRILCVTPRIGATINIDNNYWRFRSTPRPISVHCLLYFMPSPHPFNITTINLYFRSPKPRWYGGSRDRVTTGIEPANCRSQERPTPQTTRPPMTNLTHRCCRDRLESAPLAEFAEALGQ